MGLQHGRKEKGPELMNPPKPGEDSPETRATCDKSYPCHERSQDKNPASLAMKPVRKQIADCLRHVDDPELGINIVDLGLIYDLQFDSGDLAIKLTMTTPACPLSDYIKNNIQQVMRQVDGVDRLRIDVVWEPAWSPQMMDPEVRRRGFRHPPPQYT